LGQKERAVQSNILKAGVLSISGVSTSIDPFKEDEAMTETKEAKNEAFDEYISAILAENVVLNTLDLAK
jgi:hypothetical protein